MQWPSRATLGTWRRLAGHHQPGWLQHRPLTVHRELQPQLSWRCLHATSASSAPGQSVRHDDSSPAVPHVSVLLQPILDLFKDLQVRTYVDGTLGAGGHACAMLQQHPELQLLIGVDLDPTAHQIAGAKLQAAARPTTEVKLVRGNYRDIKAFLTNIPVAPAPPTIDAVAQGTPSSVYGNVDAMLLDLGVSSMQLDTAERGFSFLRDGRIDMRMDPGAVLSAEEIINTWPEAELGRILRDYGEEKMWRQVARRIVGARSGGHISTTMQLVDVIGRTQLGGGKGGKKGGAGGGKHIHPATRTFQALRIAVNDEINKLEQALPDTIGALRPGGRLAIISFHSLEDRAVKRAFARACGKPTPEDEHLMYGPGKFEYLDQLEANATAKLVTRKPVVASDDEIQGNPRSRSAKLRVIERLGAYAVRGV